MEKEIIAAALRVLPPPNSQSDNEGQGKAVDVGSTAMLPMSVHGGFCEAHELVTQRSETGWLTWIAGGSAVSAYDFPFLPQPAVVRRRKQRIKQTLVVEIV